MTPAPCLSISTKHLVGTPVYMVWLKRRKTSTQSPESSHIHLPNLVSVVSELRILMKVGLNLSRAPRIQSTSKFLKTNRVICPRLGENKTNWQKQIFNFHFTKQSVLKMQGFCKKNTNKLLNLSKPSKACFKTRRKI